MNFFCCFISPRLNNSPFEKMLTSDAAVIAVRNGIFTILATAHDLSLGGDNLDTELVEYFASEFQKKYQAKSKKRTRDPWPSYKANSSITKKTLSNATSATISIDSLADGFDYHASINRMRPIGHRCCSLTGGVSFTPKLTTNLEYTLPESVEILGPQNKNASNNPNGISCIRCRITSKIGLAITDADELAEALQPVIVNTPHLKKPIGLIGCLRRIPPSIVTITSRKRLLEPTPKEENAEEDDESEWSDDEPEVVREKLYTLGTKLMELGIKTLTVLKLSLTLTKTVL
ncbi:AKR_HP2_G0023490.mRNA.1.CDS.1 [Saccharomyces cerevisiae]|nr:AKR_HP2_G0023490.mRNA.1.CDS.1 [Saccharomyces cerevisiae]CAI6472543.1 AKR_HP2_G0023490.mRNA.1.CDS.1 [Saccharomyces cerevisiae]